VGQKTLRTKKPTVDKSQSLHPNNNSNEPSCLVPISKHMPPSRFKQATGPHLQVLLVRVALLLSAQLALLDPQRLLDESSYLKPPGSAPAGPPRRACGSAPQCAACAPRPSAPPRREFLPKTTRVRTCRSSTSCVWLCSSVRSLRSSTLSASAASAARCSAAAVAASSGSAAFSLKNRSCRSACAPTGFQWATLRVGW
jgi:hypothetical protein